MSIGQNLWKSNKGRGHAYAKHLQAQPGCRVLNALSCAHQPNWAFNSDANTGQGQYWCPPRFALRRRLTLALGFSCHSSSTTSRASTARCHLSARQHLTQHREVRTLPSRCLPTTAQTVGTEWRLWDATSQRHQSQTTLLGWQPRAFGKRASVFREVGITATIPSQRQSKPSPHLLSSIQNTHKELGSRTSGTIMRSRTTRLSILGYSSGAASVTSLTGRSTGTSLLRSAAR